MGEQFLILLGGLVAGIFIVEVLRAFARKMVTADYITKTDCKLNREACTTCIQAMKERQNVLRESTLPKEYVAKSDFRREMDEVKEWLQSIDGKVEAILMRKEDLFAEKKPNGKG